MIVTCPGCKQKNRAPEDTKGKRIKCGKCKRDLTSLVWAKKMLSADSFGDVFDDLFGGNPFKF